MIGICIENIRGMEGEEPVQYKWNNYWPQTDDSWNWLDRNMEVHYTFLFFSPYIMENFHNAKFKNAAVLWRPRSNANSSWKIFLLVQPNSPHGMLLALVLWALQLDIYIFTLITNQQYDRLCSHLLGGGEGRERTEWKQCKLGQNLAVPLSQFLVLFPYSYS